MLRLIVLSLTLSSIYSCKFLPPIEICKYKADTYLCLCKSRDMFTGQSGESYRKEPEYCFKGVIVSAESWPDLSSFLRKVGENKRAKRILKRNK